MKKFRLKKGWTKRKVLNQFKRKNDGTCAQTNAGECVYRTNEGNACAVGAFIPDMLFEEKYNLGVGVSDLLIAQPQLKQFMPLAVNGLKAMQVAHDDCYGSTTYEAMKQFLDEQTYEVKR